jgi:hypothetical protein
MISPNKIMGSILYRTREALRNDKEFNEGLKYYPFYKNLINDKGEFILWHRPGTQNRDLIGKNMRFVSVFNFQTIDQSINILSSHREATYNLAFVTPVFSEWGTSRREKEVFDTVLRPVVEEFLFQVKTYTGPVSMLDKDQNSIKMLEVFTTGENQGVLLEKYGLYIDAIEIHGLKLQIRNPCGADKEKIGFESNLINSLDGIAGYTKITNDGADITSNAIPLLTKNKKIICQEL